ncbi:low-complexity tail membrane protein [Pseudanabaena mucicola]|uniref:Low-complexity tail membrane protein n=1 Tax=Pseudanabaena mucicola FACHB-723 TaxID=2692860 RepID=A0ABR7ZSQ2_9CYAN|nr:low-complexity tail membrane protein [Pseudanabaena mucicola]MBD2186832.1 low-complexity tail membrane protein [Pseudanabaena mucicola FACHB-723]
MTSPNSTEPNSKISLDSPDSRNNPFIWSNIALLAAVPWLLALSMAGLAVGDPVFPAWFEILLLGAPAIAVVTWLQWQQPFFPFSLWFLAKPADSLSERERQVLSLVKQSRNGWYTTGWIAASVAFVTGVIFCRIYLSAPLAQTIAPFPMGLRLFGIVWAEIFFFLSNVLLQAGISALRVKLTPESELANLSPFAVEKVKNSFTSIGWQSPQLLKFLENDQVEEQVVSNDLPKVEDSAQPEVMQPEVIDEQQDAQDAGESEETLPDSSEPAEVIAESESSDLEVSAEVYEEVSEIAIANLHTEESNEEVSEIAIAEFAEVDQVAEETEQIIEVSYDLADQTDASEEILVSELAEVEPEQLVTASDSEELEPITEVELSPESNEIITDVISDQPEIEEIQDLDTTQVFTEAEHLATVVDHPEVEAEPIETAAEITEEVVTETQELEINQESESLTDEEPEVVATIEEEFIETTQAINESNEEVIVALEDTEEPIAKFEEEVIVAIEDSEPIAENVDQELEVIFTAEDTESINESEEEVIVAIETSEEEIIEEKVIAAIADAETTTKSEEELIVSIEDAKPIAENIEDVLETATEAEQEQEQTETTPENLVDEPIVDSSEPLEIAETMEENIADEQPQIDTAVENALMEFDINTVAKENKKTLGFAKKTRKAGSPQKKKGFGKSIKSSDDEILNAPEAIAIAEETAAIAEPVINEVEQSNDSDNADNLATPTETPVEEIAEAQKKSPKYLVEEFLVDKFLARLEELNNPDKDNKNTQVGNSEPVNTSEPPTQNNDEFADLEALIDRKSSLEDSE